MKTITLTQPWATLVAIGAKKIETRSWYTAYRGPLAIHAAKGFPKWAKQFTAEPVCYEAVMRRRAGAAANWFPAYPTGAVIATCTLVDCMIAGSSTKVGMIGKYAALLTPTELAFGDYDEGRYAWILGNVECFEHPIQAKGALGLWEWRQK